MGRPGEGKPHQNETRRAQAHHSGGTRNFRDQYSIIRRRLYTSDISSCLRLAALFLSASGSQFDLAWCRAGTGTPGRLTVNCNLRSDCAVSARAAQKQSCQPDNE